MMEFHCTCCCGLTDKLKIISNEIVNEYPKISAEDALKIASLCDDVTDFIDNNVLFRRYYYILFVINEDKALSREVYNDMKKNSKGLSSINKKLFIDIKKYFEKNGKNFPIISDYYV